MGAFYKGKVLPRNYGQLTHPATKYVPLISGQNELTGIHIAWFDAVSSATITLQTSNYDEPEAAWDVDETAAGKEHLWAEETGVTITGPAAVAADCEMVHVGNIGAKRARLKIVTAADCDLEVLVHGKS